MDRREKATRNRDKGPYLNKTWGVGAAQARYSGDGHWYARLTRFPAALFDAHGYLLFKTEQEYCDSPRLKIGKQISIRPPGISAIPGYVRVVDSNATSSLEHQTSEDPMLKVGDTAHPNGGVAAGLNVASPLEHRMSEDTLLTVGDTVHLNSGGALMTIISMDNNSATCAWFVKGVDRRQDFPIKTLKKSDGTSEKITITLGKKLPGDV
jgi:uncharacterized protein YodC (DUF2158 family)